MHYYLLGETINAQEVMRHAEFAVYSLLLLSVLVLGYLLCFFNKCKNRARCFSLGVVSFFLALIMGSQLKSFAYSRYSVVLFEEMDLALRFLEGIPSEVQSFSVAAQVEKLLPWLKGFAYLSVLGVFGFYRVFRSSRIGGGSKQDLWLSLCVTIAVLGFISICISESISQHYLGVTAWSEFSFLNPVWSFLQSYN